MSLTCLADNPGERNPDWQLVFEDEFSTPTLNEQNWNRIPYVDWSVADWRVYQSQDASLTEADADAGTLTLWGRYGDYSTQAQHSGLVATGVATYACGAITTQGTFSFRHGYVEVRARFDCASGVWPAIWMLPVSGSWPASGEIDIMEHLNYQGTILQTIHYASASGGDVSQVAKPTWTDPQSKLDWHTYGMEWTEDAITFYLDGVQTGSFTAASAGELWPYGEDASEFYLILSQQIGGSWVTDNGTRAIDQALLASTGAAFELDYVKVYSTANAAAVPEPASGALLLPGLAWLALFRRRQGGVRPALHRALSEVALDGAGPRDYNRRL